MFQYHLIKTKENQRYNITHLISDKTYISYRTNEYIRKIRIYLYTHLQQEKLNENEEKK